MASVPAAVLVLVGRAVHRGQCLARDSRARKEAAIAYAEEHPRVQFRIASAMCPKYPEATPPGEQMYRCLLRKGVKVKLLQAETYDTYGEVRAFLKAMRPWEAKRRSLALGFLSAPGHHFRIKCLVAQFLWELSREAGEPILAADAWAMANDYQYLSSGEVWSFAEYARESVRLSKILLPRPIQTRLVAWYRYWEGYRASE